MAAKVDPNFKAFLKRLKSGLYISGTLQGAQEAVAKLQAVDRSMRKRIQRKGVRKASMLGAKIAKNFVPTRHKVMRNSMGWRMAKARAAAVRAIGIVGPRRRYTRVIDGKKHVPTNYAHLVEAGTAPHAILPQSGKSLAFKGRHGETVVVPGVNHPGARATHFLRRGNSAARGPMLHVFTRTVTNLLAIEAAKPKPSEVDDG